MQINISKCDAIHIMNWLNAFKTLCNDPKVGMHYLVPEIQAVRERLFEAYKPIFGDYSKEINPAKRHFDMIHKMNDQVKFPTGDDYWFCDKSYQRV